MIRFQQNCRCFAVEINSVVSCFFCALIETVQQHVVFTDEFCFRVEFGITKNSFGFASEIFCQTNGFGWIARINFPDVVFSIEVNHTVVF